MELVSDNTSNWTEVDSYICDIPLLFVGAEQKADTESCTQSNPIKMAKYMVKPPEHFSFRAADWPQWSSRWERFHRRSGLAEEDDQAQIDGLIYQMGASAENLLKSFRMNDVDIKKYACVLKKFNDHYETGCNVIYERAVFNRRKEGDHEDDDPVKGIGVENFITHLWTLSETCQYEGMQEQLVRDRIVVGIKDTKLSEKLAADKELTLEKAIRMVKEAEANKRMKKLLQGTNEPTADVDALKFRKGKFKPKQETASGGKKASASGVCNWCGYHADHSKKQCPARDEKCNICKKKGHFSKVCRSKKSKVNEIAGSSDDSDDYFLGSITMIDAVEDWKATLHVGRVPVEFKIDTGADVTVIPERVFNPTMGDLQKTDRRLCGPGNNMLSLAGMVETTVRHREVMTTQQVYVVKGLEKPLLGRPAIEKLGLLKRVREVEVKVKERYPELFKGLGNLKGEYEIRLRPDATPYALTSPRRIAQPLLEKVKKELERMLAAGVISKVTEPTEWCSGIVVVPRPETVRICIDLTKLNEAVQRELYVMPSVDESLAKLAGAKIFTKLDANNSFWQITLSPDSAKLTTFITPFGRFCFNRLPYGLNSAPEHFMRVMAQVLDSVEGVVCHVDDILVYGKDQEEHDRRLEAAMTALSAAGITLNERKCAFSKSSVEYLGHMISENQVSPDPSKTEAIEKMEAPQDASGVRRFLGMLNHLGKFIPHLATQTKPLRDLLVSSNEWTWEEPQKKAFDELKSVLKSNQVLKLYDPNIDTLVSADSSSFGLGAVLLQKQSDGKWGPVAYASRALTPTEQRYAQVEKEALATTWACERFHMFIFGRSFEVETDHKPLVSLLGSKLLDELPPRILRFRLRLMKYKYTIFHVPGKKIATADTLSRAPLHTGAPGEKSLEEDAEAYVHFVIDSLPVTEKRLLEIKEHLEQDEVLRKVMEYCQNGWPEYETSIQDPVKPYWKNSAELTVEQGLLLKGCRLVIPATLRLDILDRIHAGHQGITRCRSRAQQSVWWPGLSKQIEELVKNCNICEKTTHQRSEPLIPGELPERPWQKVGTDLFELEGKTYLLVVDYHSRYPEVARAHSTTSKAIIGMLKSMFARHGIPEIVMSDNGPQYSSAEFLEFSKKYGFTHITSSPRYPQSNGEAERAVQTIKNLLTKAEDPCMALLSYRSTPLRNGYSPAQLLFGRKLRTTLPMIGKELQPSLPSKVAVQEKEETYRAKMKENFDHRHGTRLLERLKGGDRVYLPENKQHGVVINPADTPRSYKVQTPDGTLRRNRRQIIASAQPGTPGTPKRSTPPTSPVQRQSPSSSSHAPSLRRSTRDHKPAERLITSC